ncbi:class I SAM-dependent methyltransferase [Mangrovimicrobium sediminis]|uniref:class I SAM-dependent methyltransferase n=1 Tax=Mangrovimicrobium sediminis TaxID=2562682 RepID=UPI001436BD31|nr:class I SAM-dependent methyltransferase [Haliea sp. SAOS-164]
MSTHASDWDYSEQAPYYQYRPNYSPLAIDTLLEKLAVPRDEGFLIADVGAGTGNLTIMLEERGYTPIAIEPNDAMREIGIQRSASKPTRWQAGTGEATGLPDKSVQAYLMGSSFNTTERDTTLKEAHRVLADGGWFACMWNHRSLEEDEIQSKTQAVLKSFFPDYTGGSRREDQRPILEASPYFSDVHYLEDSFTVQQTKEHYLLAWRSVRNQFWDLRSDEGKALFEQVMAKMSEVLPDPVPLTYTTRIWYTQKS